MTRKGCKINERPALSGTSDRRGLIQGLQVGVNQH